MAAIKKSAKKEDPVLKIRIPRELMERVNTYRHRHEMDTKTEAVMSLLSKSLDDDDVIWSNARPADVAQQTQEHQND